MIWAVIGAFMLGEALSVIVTIVISGKLDDYTEWRKKWQ